MALLDIIRLAGVTSGPVFDPGKEYALTIADAEAAITKGGCLCRKGWRLADYSDCATAMNGWCCDPNGDPAGPWCLTAGTCGGASWDRCNPWPSRPAGLQVVSRALGAGGEWKPDMSARLLAGFTMANSMQDVGVGKKVPQLGLEVGPEGKASGAAPLTNSGCVCKAESRCSAESGWCCNAEGHADGPWCNTASTCAGRTFDLCTPSALNRAVLELVPGALVI